VRWYQDQGYVVDEVTSIAPVPRPIVRMHKMLNCARPGSGATMGCARPWHYDELKHCGVDYADPSQAAAYDAQHQKFRDYKAAAIATVEALAITPDHVVIDMGCGTGAFAIHAATFCRHIHAVDVSPAMLAIAQDKAQRAGLSNISFHQGGWLSYRHTAEPADAITSTAVLHHLPDYWKLRGLRNVCSMLKPGGRLQLFDVVFRSNVDDEDVAIGQWVDRFRQLAGDAFAQEVITHIRDEYSTYDWILEGLIQRAGLRIDQANYAEGFTATYLCTRTERPAPSKPSTSAPPQFGGGPPCGT